jgi:hypothetical protein
MWSSTSYGIDFIYIDFALQLSAKSGTPPDPVLVSAILNMCTTIILITATEYSNYLASI